MSTKCGAIKELENYSSQEFANFLGENGFSECKDYIIGNEIVYSNFMDMQEIHLWSWKQSIHFSNFKNFCQLHRKLQTSPESFFTTIGTNLKNNIQQRDALLNSPVGQKNSTSVSGPPKTNILMKPSIASKPIMAIKQELSQKPKNLPLKNVNNKNNTEHGNSNFNVDVIINRNANVHIHKPHPQVKITEELIEKIAKLNSTTSKPLPIPPKSINLATVPNLPEYFEYNSNPSSRQASENDNYDDNAEEEAMYNKSPIEEKIEDGENTYCEADDVEDPHIASPTFTHLQVSPKIDRQNMPKPPAPPMHTNIPQINSRYNNGSNNYHKRNTEYNFVVDEDNDDVHVYEVLPPSPKASHAKGNTYSMDPTHSSRRIRLHPDEDYLEPRNAVPQIQPAVERSRPLPPIPEQDYTLGHFKNETYFRDVDRKSAEKILRIEPIGTFLVRPSKKFFCCFVIKSASKIVNIGIVKLEGNKFHLDGNTLQDRLVFHSITDMINFYIDNGISFPDGDKIMDMRLRNVLD